MTDAINIRASSIASIIDCPLRGLSIATGLVKQLPSTVPAVIGSACHEGTAAFDNARVHGSPISADDAADVVEDYIKHPAGEVDWGTTRPEQALTRALGVHTKYCNEIAPLMEYEQVELTLDPLVVDVAGIDIELTGTLDRVYSQKTEHRIIRNHGILDVKTGARACSQKPGKHKAQIGVYELLAEHTLGLEMNLPGLIGQLQTSSNYDVGIGVVEDARTALIGDENQIGLMGHIGLMLKSGDWYGNSSSWLCSEKYCPLYQGCVFK